MDETSTSYARALFDAQPTIVIYTDGENIMDANKAFFDFFDDYILLEEFLEENKCLRDFFESVDQPNYLQSHYEGKTWIDVLRENRGAVYKTKIIKKGAVYIFSVNYAMVEFENKLRDIITFTDISKDELTRIELAETLKNLKEKENMLILQSRMAAMGEMISMIAHQWRQPISMIAMGANNIITDTMMDNYNKEEFSEMGYQILDMTQQLSKTIDDFRNFFKLDKEKEECDIAEIMEEALSLLDKSFENNDTTLHKHFSHHVVLEVFRRELMQVFINILTNAKEALFTHRQNNRWIVINIYETIREAVIEITNNGGIIPLSIIKQVFDPYFTTNKESNGTGLGLYMSITIIEKHLGGKISVENTSDGCRFTIVIPK